VSTATSSSVDSEEDGGDWAGADFSGLSDPRALRQFLSSSNYLLEDFDSDDKSHDPSRECFMCDRELCKGASDENKGEHTPADATSCIATHVGGAAMPPPMRQSWPQLEQLHELERKLEEERQQLVQLHVTLEQELRSHNDSGVARCRACDVHHRIYNDDSGDHPPLFARASQNITVVAILLWTMLEPSTPEGRQAHEELHALLERAAVQQTKSFVSR
jgi:hypothetical protein